jgi:L-malate glycosyltransferase
MPSSTRRTHLAYLGNGLDYHIHRWLPALADAGLEVTLLTYTPPAEMPGETVRIHPLVRPWRRDRSTPIRYSDFLGPTGPLEEALSSLGIDVLMASFATTYGWLASRSGFRPLIVQTWSRDVTEVPFRGWKRGYFRPVVKRVLRAADVITTDGPAYADLVRRRFPEAASKVISTLWGIPLAEYDGGDVHRLRGREALQIPEDALVCTSGRGVRSWYRPEVALPALRKALEAHPTLYVVVLTLGHERTQAVASELDRLRSHPRARVFDRFLSSEEMRGIWAASDLIVSIPQFDGVSEGVLEAMLSGAIPILSDIPTNRAVFGGDGKAFFVQGGDADELADRILGLCGRLPALQSTLVPSNRSWVRASASVEATARQVAQIVHSLSSGCQAIDPAFRDIHDDPQP